MHEPCSVVFGVPGRPCWAVATASGMCGGIATALGALTPAALPRAAVARAVSCAAGIVSYAALRRASRAALGCAGGAFGGARRLPAPWPAVVIVLMGLNLTIGNAPGARWLRAPERWGAELWRRVQPRVARRLPQRPVPRALLAGSLWGWLPCGLVYSALLAATAAGSAGAGVAPCSRSALGTVPAHGRTGRSRRAACRAWRDPAPRFSALTSSSAACGPPLIPARALLSAGRSHCEHQRPFVPSGEAP